MFLQCCNKCQEVKETDHSCDADALLTMDLIHHDCRNCPCCGTTIYRVSGCPQMFCISCKTAFCWLSGRVYEDLSEVHNPHLTEFLEEHGSIVSCRDVNDEVQVMTSYRAEQKFGSQRAIIINAAGIIWYLHYTVIPYLRQQFDLEKANKALRIAFLLNEIDEAKFKRHLQRNEKKFQKRSELISICRTITHVGSDLLRQERVSASTVAQQLQEFQRCVNTAFFNVSKQFKCMAWSLEPEWSQLKDCMC